ncbi:MAG: thiol peroxidase [Polyangiaceae bacterium]|nr:thiol peroxidase [Myxococcales bacterium]MCB9586255.1 thiol peroxidase [Polyangiaceae bacterium]MCB9606932.1 thiol peroxidase [Polyangiaceae bacterium]
MAETRKGAITLKGNPLDLVGPELKAGDKAPDDFTLIGTDMAPVTGKDLSGKARILCAVPSLDTPVCDVEMKRFNEEAANLNLEVIAVSVDLPFAQKRWCGATGSDKIKTLSDWKFKTFGPAYGVEAPGFGLLARAVFVIGADDVVRHVEYVPEIGQEPNYGAALEAAKGL